MSLSIPTIEQLEMMREAALDFEKASTSQSESENLIGDEFSDCKKIDEQQGYFFVIIFFKFNFDILVVLFNS